MAGQAVTQGAGASFDLTGTTTLVTGAGRGLGRAIALALADAGGDVVLLSRTRPELEELAELVVARGRRAEVVACDVTDLAATARAIEGLAAVDALVATAGTNVPEPFVDVEAVTYDRVMDVNVRAAFFTAQAVARRMVATGTRGAIVLMSSQMGHVGAARRTVYCASKHAVEGLTKALAVELAPNGIRVNAVAPTYVRTSMTEPFFSDEKFHAHAVASIPLGRIGEVADVTGAVVYLCSPAAGLVTGTSLVVDGGYTAQ
ncbi:MAG: short-chain alcohol dehydrogenase [Conexibacter sp.]|nr:short-chain alcohol dehydrogenase [Conexibacter sp.]